MASLNSVFLKILTKQIPCSKPFTEKECSLLKNAVHQIQVYQQGGALSIKRRAFFFVFSKKKREAFLSFLPKEGYFRQNKPKYLLWPSKKNHFHHTSFSRLSQEAFPLLFHNCLVFSSPLHFFIQFAVDKQKRGRYNKFTEIKNIVH